MGKGQCFYFAELLCYSGLEF